MTRYFLSTLCPLVASSLLIVSCDSFEKSGEISPTGGRVTEMDRRRIEQVGRLHNQALTFVRNELSKRARKDRKTNLREVIATECAEFARAQTIAQTHNVDVEELEQGCATGLLSVTRSFTSPKKHRSADGIERSPSVPSEEQARALSGDQIRYLNRVFRTLGNSSCDMLHGKLLEIEENAISKLGREAIVVLLASSVGRHSAKYWGGDGRVRRWIRTIKKHKRSGVVLGRDLPGGIPPQPPDSVMRKIYKADAGGAVAGAVGAAASGFGVASFGAGIAMGALTGSTAASTAEAIEQGYERWADS